MGLAARSYWFVTVASAPAVILVLLGLDFPLLPALGAGFGALAVLLSLAVAYRLGRGRSLERRHRRDQSRDAAIRRFWQASGDFERGAWARQDLETLRFLCLNLEAGAPLGERMADRLRAAVSSVLAGVLDRVVDVLRSAQDAELSPEITERLGDAARRLAGLLDGFACRAGHEPELDAPAVAEVAETILEACRSMREKMRPRISADVPPIVRWLVRSRHRPKLDAGALELALEPLGDVGPVAVRPMDLIAVLHDLIETIFERGQVAGAVIIGGEDHGEQLKLSVTWQVRDRWHLEPAELLEPMRPLSSYGAHLTVEEDLEAGAIVLEAWLPRLLPAMSRAADASSTS